VSLAELAGFSCYPWPMAMRVMMLGDVVGQPGVRALMQQLPRLREIHRPDLVIANAENAANGSGLTPTLYERLCGAGVDAMTLGDHVYRKRQIVGTLQRETNIIRPANLPAAAEGRAWMRLHASVGDDRRTGPPLYVFTVLGRLFMNQLPSDEPFAAVDRVLNELPEKTPLVIVEIHAEATSEKQALAYHLDGRACAVVGTHTHVPTADAKILPHGAAYVTDLGMTGPHASVLGRRIDRVVSQMSTAMPTPFDVAEGDPRVNGVLIEIDPASRRATSIERIDCAADVTAPPFA